MEICLKLRKADLSFAVFWGSDIFAGEKGAGVRESFLPASSSGPGSDDTYEKTAPKPKRTSKAARCRGTRNRKLSPRKPLRPGAHGVTRRGRGGGAGAGGPRCPGAGERLERPQQGRAMGAEAGGPRDTTPGQQLRALFYALPPGESSFRTVEEVPDYVEKVRVPSVPTLAASLALPSAHLRLYSEATGASQKPWCPRKGTSVKIKPSFSRGLFACKLPV